LLMRISKIVALSFLSFGMTHLSAADPVETDRKKLSGSWSGWVVEGRGDNPKQRRMAIEVTIKDGKMTGIENGKKDLGEGTFTLKVNNNSKQLDATRTKGDPGRGQTYQGIYSLDGDTLRWCVSSPPGRERPAELQSKTGQFLMILERKKK